MGQLVKRINPMESVNHFVEKVLVNNRTIPEMASWTAAPILFAVIVFGVLFLYSAPRLALEAKKARLPWPSKLNFKRGAATMLILAALCLPFLTAAPAKAQADTSSEIVQIAIDQAYREVKTGDTTEVQTTVHYDGVGQSTPMVVALNIVNLGEGDPVDPEDWSPERSQVVEPLAPGETAVQSWIINAILSGDYMIYLTVIPEPRGAGETSQPVSSPGIHLVVAAYSPLNPGGVLPVAVGMPLVLLGIFGWQKLQLQRRKEG
jgi:hypothetical protein